MDVWADIIDCRRFVSLLPPLLLIFLVPRYGIFVGLLVDLYRNAHIGRYPGLCDDAARQQHGQQRYQTAGTVVVSHMYTVFLTQPIEGDRYAEQDNQQCNLYTALQFLCSIEFLELVNGGGYERKQKHCHACEGARLLTK